MFVHGRLQGFGTSTNLFAYFPLFYVVPPRWRFSINSSQAFVIWRFCSQKLYVSIYVSVWNNSNVLLIIFINTVPILMEECQQSYHIWGICFYNYLNLVLTLFIIQSSEVNVPVVQGFELTGILLESKPFWTNRCVYIQIFDCIIILIFTYLMTSRINGAQPIWKIMTKSIIEGCTDSFDNISIVHESMINECVGHTCKGI